ncbi:hypothetical protein D3C76_1534450 [compost metagenome]
MGEQLDRAHPAQGLEKVALLLGSAHQLLFTGATQRAEPGPARQRVKQHGGDGDQRQWRAVEKHQHQRDHGHYAVEQRLDERGGEGALDGLERAEAGDDIAQVTAL